MVESSVVYSPSVAREAARYYLRQRYLTRLGLSFMGSIVFFSIVLWYDYRVSGPDWIFGMISLAIGFNLSMLLISHVLYPREFEKAVHRMPTDRADVSCDSEALTIKYPGGSRIRLAWPRIRYLWEQPSFFVIGFSFYRMIHLPTQEMTPELKGCLQNHLSRSIGA